MRHLLTLADLTAAEIERIFSISEDLKSKYAQGIREPLLPGRVLALLFEKPSLRTRASFEAAMINLGGGSMYLGPEVGWRTREKTCDFGRVLSQYADVIVVRTSSHDSIVELAQHCPSPVINGLSNLGHPCQALADLFTIRELIGPLKGTRLAYVGDCNNVARSLAQACIKLGMHLSVAAPKKYQFPDGFLNQLYAGPVNGSVTVSEDPAEAARGAQAIYTDVWTSMGQEAEANDRRTALAPYQVNAALMAHCPKAYFLHCMPAKRGEEVTDEVIDGPQSAVIQQAANRMHAQKGILAWILGVNT